MKFSNKIFSAIAAMSLLCSSFSAINVYAADKEVPTITTSIENFTNEVGSTFNLVISYTAEDYINDAVNWYEYGMMLFKVQVPFPEGYSTVYTGTGRGGAISFSASDFNNLSSINANFDKTDNTFKIDHAWTPDVTNGGALNYSHSGKVTVPIKQLAKFEKSFNFEPKECKIEALEINPDGSTVKHFFYQNDTDIATGESQGVSTKKINTVTQAKITIDTAVPVTGVTLSQSELALDLNGNASATLTATVAPDNATDKTVTWTTSADDVATVVNGVVTAKKVGTATITATAGDKSATCTVTVTDSTPADPVGTEIATGVYYAGNVDTTTTTLTDDTTFSISYDGGAPKQIQQTLAQILGGEGIAGNLTGKLHFAIKPVSVEASTLDFSKFVINVN